MKPRAPVICSHCGHDYARDYWTRPDPSPVVCFSCRRDTNPDAADAPRWEPRAHTDDQSPSPVFVVSPARKQCRMCRGEYDGLVFGPSGGLHPSKDAPLPFGICPSCSVAEDRRDALATAPVVPYTVAVRE